MKIQKLVITIVLAATALLLVISSGCKKETTDDPDTPKITDKDGNTYTEVTIGTQVWLKENIRTTKLNDGTPLELITNGNDWTISSIPSYCWYNNEAANKNKYGGLYNFHAVKTNKLCPTGYRVPSETDLQAMVTFLGGEELAGAELKESGTGSWITPNLGATNSSGFSALPGGFRLLGGAFSQINAGGYWWTSTVHEVQNAKYLMMSFDSKAVFYAANDQRFGYSVRCIKN